LVLDGGFTSSLL